MTISFKGAHFPQEIILMGVRWYVAYPLSYRHVEELLGSVLEVEMTAQSEHITCVKTRACGFQSAIYLHI